MVTFQHHSNFICAFGFKPTKVLEMYMKLNLVWLCGWLNLTGHQVPTKAALSPQLGRGEKIQ